MKKILITVVGLAIGFSFFSCNNQKAINDFSETPINIEIKDSTRENKISLEDRNQLWHATNKKVIILFGYNYNDKSFVEKASKKLFDSFGNSEDGGVIVPIVFPDEFRHKDKAVNSDLFNILNDNSLDIAGFISLGAPEKTYRALTRIQDLWNGHIPFPVISMFPQDDILGIEDTSSIVINQVQKAESDEHMITESEEIRVQDAEDILVNAVSYILELEGAPEKDASLATHVRQMLPGKKIHRYTDSETGLYSINHFVIE